MWSGSCLGQCHLHGVAKGITQSFLKNLIIKLSIMIYVALGVLGIGAFTILPSALELCVETSYPVPAGNKLHILVS